MDKDVYLVLSEVDGISTLLSGLDSFVPAGLELRIEVADSEGSPIGVIQKDAEWEWYPNADHTIGHVGSD